MKIIILFFCIFSFVVNSSSAQQDTIFTVCLKPASGRNFYLKGTILFLKKTFPVYRSDTCLKFAVPSNQKNIQFYFEAETFESQLINVNIDSLKSLTVNISIIEKNIQLQEVKVVSNQRIYQNGDTLVIKTDSIKTRPHATATELMNKLPGVSMNAMGQLNVLGKNIENITVEGKPIFSGNIKATLGAINADMIRQLELTDDADGGKTMDIRLKKNRQNGWYGEVDGNAGTPNAFGATARANKISPDYFNNYFITNNNYYERAISVKDRNELRKKSIFKGVKGAYSVVDLAMPNGIFSTPNSQTDNLLLRNINTGTLNSFNGGANYSKTSPKLEVLGNVLFDDNTQNINKTINISQPLPPYTQLSNTSNNVGDERTQINSLLNLKYIHNQRNTLSYNQSFNFNKYQNILSEIQKNKLTESGKILAEGENERNKNESSKEWSFNQQFLWLHRFKKPANFTSLYLQHEVINEIFNQRFINNYNFLSQKFSNSNRINRENINNQFNLQGVYSQPFTKGLLIEVKTNFLHNNYNLNQQGFNLLPNIEKENKSISISDAQIVDNQFINQFSLYYKTGKLTLITSPTYWQWQSVRTADINSRTIMLENEEFYPNTFIEYRTKNSVKVSFRNYLSQTLPSIDKLRIIPDSSNLQNINVGNPNLLNNPKYVSDLNFSGTFSNNYFSLSSKYEFGRNQTIISNSLNALNFFNNSFSQFGNGENYNLTALWYQFNRTKPLSFYILSSFVWQKTAISINDNVNPLNSFTHFITGNLKWTINPNFDLKLDLTQTYSGQKIGPNGVFNANTQSEVNLKLDKSWKDKLYTDFNIKFINNVSSFGQSNNYTLMDFSAYQYFLKNNKLKVSLTAKNILDVNTIYMNNISQGIQRESFTDRLPRIIMFGATFYLEKWK
ncbi:MAG: hypothetical protein U5N85_11565 [Arcicella sp.]|nr:hypothetical protein [Arcicella sp.]